MDVFGQELILLGIAVVIALIGWALKKEHQRVEACEVTISEVGDRLARAINDIAKNNVADHEWRKRVEENHKGLLKSDEDRRGDARKIYDKIGSLENAMHKEIQRLGEKVAKRQ